MSGGGLLAPEVFGLLSLTLGLYLIAIRPSWLSVAMYCLMVASTLSAIATALGTPIPLALASWELPAKPKILAAQMVEGKEIDILIAGAPPLLVSVPWDEPTAVELHDALKAAAQSGNAVVMGPKKGHGQMPGRGFNPWGAHSMGFYNEPPAAPPDKDGE